MGAMLYRTMEKTGDKLSVLGYGCMRFPRNNIGIDEKRARQQVLSAIEQGVNYFDTAYLYPGSEKVLGNILAGGLREKVRIATKLPPMMVKSSEDIHSIFQKQLDRLQTDHIDYYLVHNVSSFEDWQRLKKLGILAFVQEEQQKGRIRHFGFSFHGNLLTFKRLVDDHPWDFCQIQYNYLDENFQAGTEGLHYAAEKGLGIIVMEPLRGGTLGAKIPEPVRKVLHSCNPQRSPAQWALQWVFAHPEVSVVLSGMDKEEHIRENIRVASSQDGFSFTEREAACLEEAKQIFREKVKVPCTGCAYCLPCPHGVDIPTCFAWYNNRSVHGGLFSTWQYALATEGAVNGNPTKASNCKSCGVCEKRCPQQINIPARLKEAAAEMEKPYIRIPIRTVLRIFSRRPKDA